MDKNSPIKIYFRFTIFIFSFLGMPLKATELVRKVNANTPNAGNQGTLLPGNVMRFHIPYVGSNALLNTDTLLIRGKFFLPAPATIDGALYSCSLKMGREGVHGFFKRLTVLHGDRIVEQIDDYNVFASWYSELHWGEAFGAQLRSLTEYSDWAMYQNSTSSAAPNNGGLSQSMAPLAAGYEFAFAPLSAILGARATKKKFPLCVLNPMEPLVLELELAPGIDMHFTNRNRGYSIEEMSMNCDYDMMGSGLGGQLRKSMSGITWDILAYEQHIKDMTMPASTTAITQPYSYGGIATPDVEVDFYIRSNVQAMTRMIHYFRNMQIYFVEPSNSSMAPLSLIYPELTQWQYSIDNQTVPDQKLTATIFSCTTNEFAQTQFGMIAATSFKTMGCLRLAADHTFNPMHELLEDYGAVPVREQGTPSSQMFTTISTSEGYPETGPGRGEDGGFFLAYDFTRSVDTPTLGRTYGSGSFRLKNTDFIVSLGMNNKLTNDANVVGTATTYPLRITTLVEYKRHITLDKLGRLEAYF